ncbi:MAG: ABC transporter permease [Lachnospiraceae bacterium]|jgi:ribose/xylose/arabinose/galactoside ABC-type transport system permease subunit|nr:ABC transporter permease [Lachnospiraceae bacterium]
MDKKGSKSIYTNKDELRLFMGKYGIGVILFVMLIALIITVPSFRTTSNFINILKQVSINGMIAYGMCVVIATGGIDLAVGAQCALVACLLGQFIMKMGMNVLLSCALAVLFCAALGFVNGFLVAKFNMFPFVVTLSTQLIIRGLAQVISSAQAISMTNAQFKLVYLGMVGPIPFPVVMLFVVTILMYMILHWMKLGRYILATGGNEKAAIASGVSVFWTKIAAYVISGFLSGVAGVILTSKTSSAQSNLAVGYETDAVAACVIGGTSFAGGVATTPGVLIGILIIGFIYNGMNLIGVNSYYQTIVKGIMIIAAVLLDLVMNRKNR